MDEVEGAIAESPTAETVADPSAGTQNTGQGNGQVQVPAEKPAPFHLHPRWQQMQSENRAIKSELAQLRAWRQQQAAQQGQEPVDPETAAAHKALEQLVATHPKLKAILGVGDQVQQLQQQLQRVSTSQMQSIVGAGRTEISALAKGAGLPVTERALNHYEKAIAHDIAADPDKLARLKQGDLSVIRDAFNEVKADVGELRRGEAAALTATKDATRNLPPRPSGGVPGAPTPQPFSVKPGEDARGATSRLHKMARELGDRLTG